MTTTNTSSRSGLADAPDTGAGGESEHPLAQAGEEAGQTAGHLAERAADVGFQQADRAREQTAEGLNQLAGSVRRVGLDVESEQPTIANLASTAAEQAERVAGYLRETDARQLVHTVEDVARRQPLLFVGGAFLLGLAASRFIKAAGGGGSQGGTGTAYRSGGYRMDHPAGGYGAGNRAAYEATGPGPYGTGPGTDRPDDVADEGFRP